MGCFIKYCADCRFCSWYIFLSIAVVDFAQFLLCLFQIAVAAPGMEKEPLSVHVFLEIATQNCVFRTASVRAFMTRVHFE